jgi:hypothetical protein
MYHRDMVKRVLVFSLCIVLLGAGCFRWSNDKEETNGDAEAVGGIPFQNLEDFIPSEDEIPPLPEDLPLPPEDASPKPGEVASMSENVVVSSIVENQMLQNPFVILGRARAFENTVNWRIRDQHHKVVSSGIVMTNAPEVGRFGSFRVRGFLDRAPGVERGYVEVYTLSPRDGSEQDMVKIPIRFDEHVTPVKIFFSNLKEDPNLESCDRVEAYTRRIAKTVNVAEATILELLKGPLAAEQALGARTSIFPGTVLRSISIEGGVATVDFSKEFTYAIAGSCHVQAIIAQVNETLKQFESVEVVKMKVEGEDAELELQP